MLISLLFIGILPHMHPTAPHIPSDPEMRVTLCDPSHLDELCRALRVRSSFYNQRARSSRAVSSLHSCLPLTCHCWPPPSHQPLPVTRPPHPAHPPEPLLTTGIMQLSRSAVLVALTFAFLQLAAAAVDPAAAACAKVRLLLGLFLASAPASFGAPLGTCLVGERVMLRCRDACCAEPPTGAAGARAQRQQH